MKKLLVIVMCVLLLLTSAGCGAAESTGANKNAIQGEATSNRMDPIDVEKFLSDMEKMGYTDYDAVKNEESGGLLYDGYSWFYFYDYDYADMQNISLVVVKNTGFSDLQDMLLESNDIPEGAFLEEGDNWLMAELEEDDAVMITVLVDNVMFTITCTGAHAEEGYKILNGLGYKSLSGR